MAKINYYDLYRPSTVQFDMNRYGVSNVQPSVVFMPVQQNNMQAYPNQFVNKPYQGYRTTPNIPNYYNR